MNHPRPLDPAALERLCRLGGKQFAGEMIDLFLDFAGKKVAEARRAALAGDLPSVQKAVHPVKSSAGNVGATCTQEWAARLEMEAQRGQAEGILATLSELEQAFAAASLELAAVKQKLAGPAPTQS